jgi:hypothetical protein
MKDFSDPTPGVLRHRRTYVTDLTREKKVDHFSERQICEIVWLVASEHLYNMTNIGLNIHSDMLCDVSKRERRGSTHVFSTPAPDGRGGQGVRT